MKILITEDDLSSRKFLYKFMSAYGECDITVDGMEALDAFLLAVDEGDPYDLVCIDIMMPKVDGVKVLQVIRDLERQKNIPEEKRTKTIMTTALNDVNLVKSLFEYGCEAYATKPIDIKKLTTVMEKLGFSRIEDSK